MPTYEYACETCGHSFEEFQAITAKPLRKCPKCGKPKLKRLIGVGAAVLFKGSGFYTTDYRSSSYKSAEKADKPTPAADSNTASTSESTTKSESKPAAKPTTSK